MRDSNDAMTFERATGWAACAAALVVSAACGRPDAGDAPDPAQALQAGLEAVARDFPVPHDRPLRWPADHALHPRQFTESWLIAGLLRDQDGRRYGFQLWLQRVALAADAPARESAWAAGAAWQGVFSIEPEEAPRIREERFSREALGLAAASEELAAAWLEDWRIEIAAEAGTARVRGAVAGAALDLSLRLPGTAPADTFAEARRGYWWPDLDAAGILVIGGEARSVQGGALLDRSWGQSPPVGRGQLALARLWTQDDDGTAVHCEQLRRRGGGGVPLGNCTEWPSGQSVTPLPAPAAVAEADTREGRAPLEWRLSWQGAATPVHWAPLAAVDDAGAAWSGVIVPAGDAASSGRWGFLSLSNFSAP